MCGIFGFWAEAGAGGGWNGGAPPARHRRWSPTAVPTGPMRPAGSRRARAWRPPTCARRPRACGGAGPLPAVDHRPVRRRPPADAGRGRHLDQLQRRDLQLPGAAPELEAAGHRFRTGSDTEVILAAYGHGASAASSGSTECGPSCCTIPAPARLIASRDRLGVKPLYYARTAAGVVFGSEIAALLECPGVSREVVPARLAEWLVSRRLDHEDGHDLP